MSENLTTFLSGVGSDITERIWVVTITGIKMSENTDNFNFGLSLILQACNAAYQSKIKIILGMNSGEESYFK